MDNISTLQICIDGDIIAPAPHSDFEYTLTTEQVALGYGVTQENIRQHKRRQAEELIEGKHWVVTDSHTLGGVQAATLWTKRGVIRLGFFIRSERARRFRDMAEDLVVQHLEQKPVVPQDYLTALKALVAAEEQKQALALKVATDAPKVQSFDAYIGTDGLHDFNSAAKAIGWGRNKMLAELRRRGILMSGGEKQNVPYQSFVDKGYFQVKVRSVRTLGFERVATTTYVTPTGLAYLERTIGLGDALMREYLTLPHGAK